MRRDQAGVIPTASIALMCGPSQMPQILAQGLPLLHVLASLRQADRILGRKGLDGTRMLSSLGIYGYGEMETSRYDTAEPGLPAPSRWRIAIGEDDGRARSGSPEAGCDVGSEQEAVVNTHSLPRRGGEARRRSCGARRPVGLARRLHRERDARESQPLMR